ncbi:MAG TPA: disulfide bond formation protein B [Candidatus Paceibacterota bacterium]|nr:disulfide bond formation protein B [Candidatus Paceibacterota bacterium]
MTPLVTSVTNFLSVIVVASDALILFLLILLITPLKNSRRGKAVLNFFGSYAVTFSFLVALGSIGGSLFYSEIAHFAPCLFCWWARVLIYPQALLFFIALLINDHRVRIYGAALSAIGVLLTAYHTYLQFGGTDLVPCDATGVSCNKVYFILYGYVTIPTMALTAFALILLFCLIPRPHTASAD